MVKSIIFQFLLCIYLVPPQKDDKYFYSAKEEGSFVFVLRANKKLKFRHTHSGIKPYNVGSWSQKGDTIIFSGKNYLIDKNNKFLLYESYYYDALLPLDSSYQANKSLIESLNVEDCNSAEIEAVDSLVSIGARLNDALEHPRSRECIGNYFLGTNILISPNNIYN
ncbi:hypothetical protein [Ekhidna sp.]|uniref:hypothetical protein n=1 Tax=Ekhidna sp. TaxID=2608089 RepID=UPI003B51146E